MDDVFFFVFFFHILYAIEQSTIAILVTVSYEHKVYIIEYRNYAGICASLEVNEHVNSLQLTKMKECCCILLSYIIGTAQL